MSRKDTLRRVDQSVEAVSGSSVVTVSLGGGWGPSGGNADTVDGLHASPSPSPGKLLALNINSQFPASVIKWSDVAGPGLGVSGNSLLVQWGATPTTIQPDDTTSGGSATTSARSDHRHAIAAAAPGTIQPDDTAAEGTATSFARSDHRHAIEAAAPGTISPDDTVSEGTSLSFARADHRHAIAAAAPSSDLTFATENIEGGSTSFARADHLHAITAYADASVYPEHLLKSDPSGHLKLVRLTATDRLRTSLVDSEIGTNLRLAPTQDLDLQPGGTARVRALSGVRLQADNYASQTTGWAIGYNGAADFRYVYTDELHAKAFIADLEQSLAGGQIISKSVAPLSRDFIAPAEGATADLWVECFQGFPSVQVFAAGDTVMVRSFDRSGGELSITNCFGTVSAPYIPDPQSDPPEQRWTFTRLSGTVGGHPAAGYMASGAVVKRGALALDFGTTGNGYYEVNAIDGLMGENSPYAQNVKWAAHPWYDRTVVTRTGNLKGIFNVAGEYGLYAGTGVTDADRFVRISNQAVEAHNLPVQLYDGSNVAIVLQPATEPYMAMGVPIPTGWLTQTGWWAGKSGGVYRQYLGSVSGGDIAAGLKWDGTTLTVRGQIYVTGGDAAKTDLSNVAANTVVDKVNTAGATLIQPGRIQVSGSTTLDTWRHPSEMTLIDGGKIRAGSIVLSGLDPGGQLAGQNLLRNSSFVEDSNADGVPDDWSTGYGFSGINWLSQVSTGTYVYDGYALRLRGQRNHATGGYLQAISHLVPVHELFGPGKKFAAGIWVFRSGDTGDPDHTQLLLRALDGSQAFLSDFGSAYLTTARHQWQYVWCSGTAPASTAYLQVILRQHQTNNGEIGEVYLDGATLSVGEYPIAWSAAQRGTVFIDGSKIRVGTRNGARVEINNAGIEGYSDADTKQFYLRTDNGRAMFGGGKGVLDRTGLVLSGAETSYQPYNAVRWMTNTDPAPGGDEVARVAAGRWGPAQWDSLYLYANPGMAIRTSELASQASSKRSSGDGSNGIIAYMGLTATPSPEASAVFGASVNPGTGSAFVDCYAFGTDSHITFRTGGTTRWRITASNTAAAPSLVPQGDTNTGIYQSAADNLDFSTGGTNRLNISSTGLTVAGGGNFSSTVHVPLSKGTAVFALDADATGVSVVDNGTLQPFGNNTNFSGMFLVNQLYNGYIGIFLQGGGRIGLVSQTGSNFSTVKDTAGKINVYLVSNVVTIQNKLGVTVDIRVMALRTRAST